MLCYFAGSSLQSYRLSLSWQANIKKNQTCCKCRCYPGRCSAISKRYLSDVARYSEYRSDIVEISLTYLVLIGIEVALPGKFEAVGRNPEEFLRSCMLNCNTSNAPFEFQFGNRY
ncbi:hypothetical protein AVEN_145552-1 [Araneus ventricosus]|uniref:Uncharacterized protein n=1 Tax=Araneus ventricosus TaxID=182803 RepID=A0A4Y2UY77_ARAVE|nr:hypothetical protein AVEN_26357-1 [Araneus ventricosus]GBO17196.1 hypothetical protein AVEN_145552-1 [Araneus ventricosus]